MVNDPELLSQVEQLLQSDSGEKNKLAQLSLMMSKTVMERVAVMDSRLQKIETLLLVQAEQRKELVDWTWIRDRLVQPALIALVMWLLFTFVPNVLSKP